MNDILDSIPNPVLITGSDGNIRYLNLAANELFKPKKQVGIALSLEHLMPKHSQLLLQNFVIPTLLKEGRIQEFFIEFSLPNGGITPAYLNVLSRDTEEQTEFTWSIFTANERSKFEEAIVSIKAKLEESNLQLKENKQSLVIANSDLEQFVYIASHDLKEPLRSTRIACQFLKEDYESGNFQELEKNLQYIVDSSSRMSYLIEALLEHATIGKRSLSLERLPISNLIESVLGGLDALRKESSLKMRCELKCETILCERALFELVLQNLLQNAMKFRKKDQPADITVTSSYESSAIVRIEITDKGIGIPKEKQQEICKPFSRLHSSDEYSGSGIGLATVEKILNLHGGSLELAPILEDCTTFVLRLPDELHQSTDITQPDEQRES